MLSNFRLLISLIFTICLACSPKHLSLDEVDFPLLNQHDIDLVVYGGVVALDSSQIVILTTPGSWQGDNGNKPVRNAIVSVTDGSNKYAYEESTLENKEGYYYSKERFKGEVGKTYTIHIEVGDKTYSASDTMESFISDDFPLPISDVIAEFNFYGLEIFRHNFGYNQAMKMSGVPIDPESGLPNEGFNIERITIDDFTTTVFHNYSPPEGLLHGEVSINAFFGKRNQVYRLYYKSISAAYYDFLIGMYNESDWSTGLLSSQPGNLQTNLSKGATGFFYANDIHISELKFSDYIGK